jgi:hypothetical protein
LKPSEIPKIAAQYKAQKCLQKEVAYEEKTNRKESTEALFKYVVSRD